MMFNGKFGSAVFVIFTLFAVTANAKSNIKKSTKEIKKLSTANNRIGLKLYQTLSAEPGGNVFFSPFSLSAAFGMLLYGAKGKTEEELKTLFGLEKEGLSNEQFHASFENFLKEHVPSNDSGITLDTANLVLASKTLKVKKNYKEAVKKRYQAKVKEMNLKHAGSVVNEVNRWVKKKTHGKIEKMVDSFHQPANVVIMNVIYFNGNWSHGFSPKYTKSLKFYNEGSKAKKVPMMHVTGSYLYAENDNYQVLELPYKGEGIAMVIFLPKAKDGLRKLEKGLNLKEIYSILQKFKKRTVSISLPKFKLQYEKRMADAFRALGVKRTFGVGAADFSGITSSKEGVGINELLHKAVIEVNEKGTESAAASHFIHISSDSDQVNFKAHHPFFFVIFDKKSTMAFFVGRVNKL